MAKRLSTQSRLEAAYAAMKAENERINAVLDVFTQTAMADMFDADMRAEQGTPLGPVDGMLIGVKANIAVRGQFHHGGIKAYARDVAGRDARVVERLRAAGAIITGTLNMEEGALGAQTDNPWFGKTVNPLSDNKGKDNYTPGGSSGGSSAAVAAGFCDAALGTDTMGSVRIPSAYCGLWGFKPSQDEDMLDGVMPLSPTLDCVGAHGESLDAVTAVTEVICARDFAGGTPGQVHVLDWPESVEIEPDVARVFRDFVAAQGDLPTTPLTPYKYGASRRAGLILSEVEGFAFHQARLKADPEGFSDFFRGMLEYGARVSQEKVDAAYAHIDALRAAEFADFILMPTAPQTAFQFGDPVPAGQADFTAFANLTGRPAVQFPIGTGDNGLPIGAQLIGPRGGEADLVATIRALSI